MDIVQQANGRSGCVCYNPVLLMNKNKIWLPFISAAFVGLVVFALFAVCYGFIPGYWTDNQKQGFIALEIMLPGTIFFIFTMASIDKD